MVSKTVIGKGLPWPESVKAVISHYGNATAAATATGHTRHYLYSVIARNYTEPKSQRVKDRWTAYGWTRFEMSLPDTAADDRPWTGVEWPQCLEVAITAFRSLQRVSDYLGISNSTVSRFRLGATIPKTQSMRDTLASKGFTLPPVDIKPTPKPQPKPASVVAVPGTRPTSHTVALRAIANSYPAPPKLDRAARLALLQEQLARGAEAVTRRLRYCMIAEGTSEHDADEIANTLIDRVPIADLHELLDSYTKEIR